MLPTFAAECWHPQLPIDISSAGNPPAATAAVDQWDRQMDGRHSTVT